MNQRNFNAAAIAAVCGAALLAVMPFAGSTARIGVRLSDLVFKQPGPNESCTSLRAQAKQAIVRAAKQKTGLLHRFRS
jgi:hypothetical protein